MNSDRNYSETKRRDVLRTADRKLIIAAVKILLTAESFQTEFLIRKLKTSNLSGASASVVHFHYEFLTFRIYGVIYWSSVSVYWGDDLEVFTKQMGYVKLMTIALFVEINTVCLQFVLDILVLARWRFLYDQNIYFLHYL